MAILKKVMKAPNEIFPFDHSVIRYPMYSSIKYDGFRCLNLCGDRLLSPALKDIPNRQLPLHLNQFLQYCRLNRIVSDGELWSPSIPFNELSSIIRSFDKPLPDSVAYYIFDATSEMDWNSEHPQPFSNRLRFYMSLPNFPCIRKVIQVQVADADSAAMHFDSIIDAGGEGTILRSPLSYYKHGRCTPNENGMWKFKQFDTHDAKIIGVEEQMQMRHGIERTRNEIGELEREHSQSLYEPSGMVGAFIVNWGGQQFKVKPGKGFDFVAKRNLWTEHCTMNSIIGRCIEFKYMPHGTKDKPRIGSLVRFRPDKQGQDLA